MDDLITAIIGIIVTIMILFVIVLVPMNYYAEWQCGNYAEITGKKTKYVQWDVCYVQADNGKWFRYDSNYKH